METTTAPPILTLRLEMQRYIETWDRLNDFEPFSITPDGLMVTIKMYCYSSVDQFIFNRFNLDIELV